MLLLIVVGSAPAFSEHAINVQQNRTIPPFMALKFYGRGLGAVGRVALLPIGIPLSLPNYSS